MDESILIDLMVQMAGLEAERMRCRASLARDAGDVALLAGLKEEYSADEAEAAALLAEARAGQRKAEAELELLEANLARKRRLLAGSTVSRETLVLQQEIAGLEARQDDLLAVIFNLLDKVEQKDLEAGAVSSARLHQELQAVDKLQQIQARHSQLEAALPAIEQEIQRLHASAPAEVARHLLRLWDKEMLATVYEREGACSGCGSRLRPQQALAVQYGKELVRCPSCARFVVHQPWR